MNVPNILTILRAVLVPVFVGVLIYLDKFPVACGLIAIAVFGITSLTDMLDGKIARKFNLVTTFGKVMDPLADKFMVFMKKIADYFDYLRKIISGELQYGQGNSPFN